jgi:hypothetical protein
MTFLRCCGLALISTSILFSQDSGAARPRGNNLIQPLPELEKSLKGKLERITVHGSSLDGNLEGDSADRDVFVYLPPSYAMSACCMLDTAEVTPAMTQMEAIKTKEEALKLSFNQKSPLARAAAWSSNPVNPPLFIDLPVRDGKQRPVIAAKWMANSLLVMLQEYAPNLRKMQAIEMSVGLQDALLEPNREMDEALTDAAIAHHFETFEGDHNGQVGMNFETKVLPFFSRQLAFPAGPRP